MFLDNLIKSVEARDKKIPIKGISFDSRKTKKNDIFFAIEGNNTSGTNFIKEAVKNGAKAIVSNKKIKNKNLKVPNIIVKDVRKNLSETCSIFYKKKPKNIIAVTGTNGKTSVANFFFQILSINKIKAASIGTLGIFSKEYKKKNKLTSMDPLSLHKSLKILKENKVENVILEASSHGLDQKRLDYLNISTGIFTNLSHDHLDYHKNMRTYFNAKMYLFKNLLKKNSNIITDEQNKEFNKIKIVAKKKKSKINTIGPNSKDLKILYSKYKNNSQIVKIKVQSKEYLIKTSLVGKFQLKNLFMAAIAASKCGISYEKIFSSINKIKAIPGRLECVSSLPNNSKIIVDFAHTPDALEKSLMELKKQYKSEVVIVFGCGGDRDKKKRFRMGRVAKKYCKKIYITDDNPRFENPRKIREAIIEGCRKKSVNIGNRKKAINTAIKNLETNEILLVAGKGHENKQYYGKKIINFSDKKVIKEAVFKKKIIKKKISYHNFLLRKSLNYSRFKNSKFNGVSINSKTIKKNDIFFAIPGKKKDGHNYVKEAIKNGALKSIVNKNIKNVPSSKLIKVKNTLNSLNNLALFTREKTAAEIIGITGSVGKTTLKNLIGFSLKNYGNTYFSPYSYNNKFGVPLSVSNLKKNTQYGVFEIGMDKKGEINKLSKIVQPEIAIITNIAEAHIKNFNSIYDIAKAKAEIIDNISENGSVVLNKDDKFFNFLDKKAKKRGINVTSFSLKKKSDIYLQNIVKFKNYHQLKVKIKSKVVFFDTKNITNNFIKNVLACISVLNVLNLDLNKVKRKFIYFSLPKGRGDMQIVKKFGKEFRFVDESYNANPLSMVSAINNMNSYKRNKKSRKIIFLGDMLELGNKSKKFHKNLSVNINKSDIDKVYVCGKYIKETFNYLSTNKKGKIFKNIKEIYGSFTNIVHNNDLVMVKGSNATGFNKFSKYIKKGKISAI